MWPGDGFLAYKELESLARHTSGTLPEEDYIALCATLGADPLKGLAEPDLLKVYAELAWGDVRHDFKMLKLGPEAQSGNEAAPEPEAEEGSGGAGALSDEAMVEKIFAAMDHDREYNQPLLG